MQISYSHERVFCGSLEEVFSKGLTTAEIRPLYENFFYKIKKQTPPNKKPVKVDMIAAFMALEGTTEDLYLFVKTFPKKVYQAYELLLWKDFMPASEAQNTLDFDIIYMEKSSNKWNLDKYLIKEEFPFIALLYNHSSHYSDDENLGRYRVGIPPAIRTWLKPYFPKPEGYEIQPLANADFASKNPTTFDASPTIAADLGQLADFLIRSTPARTKKGDCTKASIRKAASLTASSDWYSKKEENPELTLMRHAMLLDFIEGFGGALIKRLTASEIREDVFKDILNALKTDEHILAKWLLGHLKNRYKYYDETFDQSAISRLFSIFKHLPLNAWVATDNLKSMQFYQDIDVLFFDPRKYGFYALAGNGKYNYENVYDLDINYLQTAGVDPLINGMAFLLSAFGFIELAYKAPSNKTYRTTKHPYLTRFDGADAVRLTDVGAYAFGLSSSLELKQNRREVAILQLHPEQLHLTCRKLDPVTELMLKEFMEPIAPEFYRMTRASILKGCQSPRDVKRRVVDFRNRIGIELPENWEQFLASLEAEKSALVPENKLKIFTLVDRPDLQRHFIQDPVLHRLALRVEGHRIAIAQDDIARVRMQLRKLGYLVES